MRVEWRIRQLDTCWFPPATLPAVAPTCRWGAGRTVWWGRTLFSSLLPGGGLGGRGRNGGGGEEMVLRRPRAVRRWLRRPPPPAGSCFLRREQQTCRRNFPVTFPHPPTPGSRVPTSPPDPVFCLSARLERAAITSAERPSLDVWATDPSPHSSPPLSSRQWGVAASGPSSPSNQSCDLLQVEDITASHEAALLEMENSHTLTLAILQDDHEHKVQGS